MYRRTYQEHTAMQFSESLKKNRDFQLTYKKGKSYANRYLVMYVRENGTSGNRLGLSVSKKVGNSVVRHRVTRLLRESYRLQEEHFRRGYDIIIIARASAKDKSYQEIESAVVHLGKLHHIYLQDTQQDSSDKGNEMEMKR